MKHPAWVKCPGCENFYCTIHEKHAHDCPCPPIEKWKVDPYTQGGKRIKIPAGNHGKGG